ncbi:MAG TPA: hypothetical protein VN420_04855 [Candidatus Fimivivens sp.]|nr:hypothetical protein [Candidatus Fimivivens sp.]
MDTMRLIFESHVARDGAIDPIGTGDLRVAYAVGFCKSPEGGEISLILKLMRELNWISYSRASKESAIGDLSEFGAFEVYHDFVTGTLPQVEFRSREAYERYCAGRTILAGSAEFSFSLADDWGGLMVERDDIGAVPYFQLVVRYGDFYGCLTEGEPPLIRPKFTATDEGTYDQHSVENGRIVDLGIPHCLLIEMDRGGSIAVGRKYEDNLGLLTRGKEYFLSENRIDI